MFRKFRETVHILTYRHVPIHPIPSPETEGIQPPSKISLRVGAFVQIWLIALVFGSVGALVSKSVFSHQSELSITTLTGIAGAVAALIGQWVVKSGENIIREKLGNPLAPFFGYKIDETVRIIRGRSRLGTAHNS